MLNRLLRHSGPLVLASLFGFCSLVGCGHTEPFGERSYDTDQPFNPSPPVQLTLNRGHDRRAAWLPDGSGIVYSTQHPGVSDRDICLAELPPTGGRQLSLICNLSPTGEDLTEAVESAAPGPDGRLAFYRASSRVGALVPERQGLDLGTRTDPAGGTTLLTIPYTVPGGRTHTGISQLRWLSPTQLVFLGEVVNVASPCPGCPQDTLRSGRDAVLLQLTAGAPPQAIPGTENASGISPGNSEDEIYYTLGGDTRVYHRRLSTGEVSVIHDFGASGIARDVHVVGTRMTAVVGGRVHFTVDPGFGPTQWDSGGIVHVVNLENGSDIPAHDPDDPGLYRRPQLSPDGSRIVAERHALILIVSDFAVDTIVPRVADLYLLGQP
jgi:WD40-like Beta Propeller Repeat